MMCIDVVKRFALGAIATFAIGFGGANAMPTQLGIAIDGSGSVSGDDFSTQVDGLAAAFAGLPIDSTVEITVVQFASTAVLEVGPVVIDSQATLDDLIDQTNGTVNGITQIGGGTVPENAINLLVQQLNGSPDSGGSSIINLSTDGGFFLNTAQASAVAAEAAGIDALTAEAIGDFADTDNLLELVFNPNTAAGSGGALLTADSAPPNPLTAEAAWVVPVTSFEAFGPVINSKIQAIVNDPTTPTTPTPPTADVPEPGAVALIGIGILAFGLVQLLSRRRVNRDSNALAFA